MISYKQIELEMILSGASADAVDSAASIPATVPDKVIRYTETALVLLSARSLPQAIR